MASFGRRRNDNTPRTSAVAVGSRNRNNGYTTTVRPMVLLLARTCLIPLASAAPLQFWARDSAATTGEEPQIEDPSSPNLYVYLGIAMALVLLGGAFAGLTIALMGQDETYLQVIATSGEGSERKHAERVLRLLKRGKHWVLVTLLLSNVITNETLPIVLDRSLGGGWPAVLSSTVLIVIFGEIAPQSVCVRYGLSIGAFCAPFVLVLMWIMCPVAWPTAKLLDWLLGEDHGTMYKKAGLKTLVQLHKTLGPAPGERLMEDEVTIINSVLDLKEKPVGDIMTPMQDVFTMSADTVLDERMMDIILSQGYSRIPIYMPDNSRNFIGMLLVKILITYDPEDAKRVRDFTLATLPETAPYTSCLDIINFFQEGKSHMVLVSDFPGQDKGALGVVTLEDVIEELIGEEIIDESDVFIDVHKAIRRLAPAPRQYFNRTFSKDDRMLMSDSDHEAKEPTEDEPLLPKDSGSRKTSLTNGNHNTTFRMRRKSSTASDPMKSPGSGAVILRSDSSDIRQHLKHLGPSNAANKPKATKFTSVKIKPGIGTIPEHRATSSPAEDGPQSPTAHTSSSWHGPSIGDIPEPVRSAGKDASDGASALHAHYGTMETSPSNRPTSPGDTMTASEASNLAEQKAAASTGRENTSTGQSPNRDNSYLRVPGKLIVGDTEAEDSLGELNTPSRERSRQRRAARSGSITETMVDVGGLNKLVLETTSSSEEQDETAAASNGNGDQLADDEGKRTPANEGPADGPKKNKKRNKRKKPRQG